MYGTGEMGRVTCLYIQLMGVPTHPQEVGGKGIGTTYCDSLTGCTGAGEMRHVTCVSIPLMGVPAQLSELERRKGVL